MDELEKAYRRLDTKVLGLPPWEEIPDSHKPVLAQMIGIDPESLQTEEDDD